MSLYIDKRVQADFDALLSHSFKLCRAEAYVGDSDQQVTVVFDPPVEFKLCGDIVPRSIMEKILPSVLMQIASTPTDNRHHCLAHTCDDWLDPIYDVEPVDPTDPRVAKYRSFYCYGKSYNADTGAVEEGDIVSIRRLDGSWAMYV